MNGPAEALHAALCLATAVWALYNLDKVRHPGQDRALWSGMVALSVGEALHTHVVYQLVARATAPGWPGALYHSAGLIAAISVVILLHELLNLSARSRRISTALGFCALILAALTLLIAPAPHLPAVPQSGPVIYDDTWQSAAHWAIFLSYLAWSLAINTWANTVYARSEPPGRLRTGMRLISAGTAVGLLYVVGHASIEIAVWFPAGRQAPRYDQLTDVLTLGSSIGLITLGAGWQQLAELIDAVYLFTAHRATLRRVRLIWPYWADLVHELPEISPFIDDMRAPSSDPDHLSWQQTRLVIEIYDALRRLLPYVADEDRALVVKAVCKYGLRDDEAQTAITSICLTLATTIHQSNTKAAPSISGDPDVPAATAPEAAIQIAAGLRRLRHRRVQNAINTIVKGMAPQP